jgi:trans-2,3-dihydro-3-hydroxyanthranilate isomerase
VKLGVGQSHGGGEVTAQSYEFAHLDVFTGTPLAGNPLTVFLQAAGLTSDEMMALTREMSFSETTFVLPAETPSTDFRVRIFGLNTGGEIPVAGHPTIGTVFALANTGKIRPGRRDVVLGLGIGRTKVDLEWAGDKLKFAWMQQGLPEFGGKITDTSAVAAALGIDWRGAAFSSSPWSRARMAPPSIAGC